MDDIYYSERYRKFLNPQHKINFKLLESRWGEMQVCAEYRTACYILSIQAIFNVVKKDLHTFKYPVDWITNYLEKGNPGKYEFNDQIIQLGKLSLSLWDEYSDFNLGECAATLIDPFYLAMKEAIEMRRKFRVKAQYHLEDYLDGEQHIYINKHRLTPEEIKGILLLFSGKDEQVKKDNKTPRGMFEKEKRFQ